MEQLAGHAFERGFRASNRGRSARLALARKRRARLPRLPGCAACRSSDCAAADEPDGGTALVRRGASQDRASGERRSTGPQKMMDAQLDKRPLVLVVDDDARSASLLARLLRADGYDTEVTTDGAAALARLTRNPVPEALVTDFHLPHADGLAVGRYARSRRAGIPIFVVTGYPHSLESAAGPLDEPIELMTKPLDYADLLRRLARVLGVVKPP